MSGHTPEPWVIDGRVRLATNFYSDDATGSIIGGCNDYQFAFRPLEERLANAARIVACVNACAGMDDPAAEIQRLRDTAATPSLNDRLAPAGWSITEAPDGTVTIHQPGGGAFMIGPWPATGAPVPAAAVTSHRCPDLTMFHVDRTELLRDSANNRGILDSSTVTVSREALEALRVAHDRMSEHAAMTTGCFFLRQLELDLFDAARRLIDGGGQ